MPELESGTSVHGLEKQIKELAALFEVSKVLVSSLDPKQTLAQILSILSSQEGMIRGTVTLIDPDTRDLSIEVAHGLTEKECERGKYRIGEGITGKVVETGDPLIVPDISREPMFLNRTRSRKDMHANATAFICVPIKIESVIYGALSVDIHTGPKAAFKDNVRILTIVASMLAQAIRVSHLLEEEKNRLRDENIMLQERLKERFGYYNIIGTSNRIRQVFEMIEHVSRSKATVFIRGESGTGKELVANAIHYNSLRAEGPFIKINCATLPDSLIESELFGHEKGSFTGAIQCRVGRFEQADKGTLFLDEIGTLNLSSQAKLLRAIQEREIIRVGGTKSIKVDVRIIAATNLDLEASLKTGAFREDLYYRINVFPIYVPPLRERKTDLSLLADHFLTKYNEKYGKQITRISASVMDVLINYSWPGNVRELENYIERAVLLCNGTVITCFHLPPVLQMPEKKGSLTTLEAIQNDFEKGLIDSALQDTNGNVAAASRILGTTERILGLRIKKYGLNPGQYRQEFRSIAKRRTQKSD